MIVGSGQLAQVFQKSSLDESFIIFASGVSNSNCKEKKEFQREKELLLATLEKNLEKKIVYFSSCALSADAYEKNEYYQHKLEMEELIKKTTSKYYIFRVPQLFGKLKEHNTLINFIYKSILDDAEFSVYNEAYRYVIEIEDLKEFVEHYVVGSKPAKTVDIANPYRYRVEDIVHIFENLLDKKAKYSLVDKEDKYTLDLTQMSLFIKEHSLDMKFGKGYLESKLKDKIAL